MTHEPMPHTKAAVMADQEVKHSPLPWQVVDQGGDLHIKDASGNSLMCNLTYYPWVPDHVEDWHFIVTAVNAHAALTERVGELEEALKIIGHRERLYECLKPSTCDCDQAVALRALAPKEKEHA